MNTIPPNKPKNQGSLDPGNLLLLLYPIVIMLLLFVGMLFEARANSVVGLRQKDQRAGDGGLWLESEEGRTTAAPRLFMDVDIQVSGIIARVKVSQKFINPSERWLEATYVFPLPDDSAVDHMDLVVGSRHIKGQIMEKQEAAATYARAINAGKKSSLLEQNRPNVFTTKVANIAPREEVGVEIEYQQRVKRDTGVYSLRFPMVVGPRYVPGQQTEHTAVELSEDTSTTVTSGVTVAGEPSEWLQVSNNVKNEDDPVIPVKLNVDLVAGFTTKEIVSLYHGVHETRIAEDHSKIEFTGEVFADRDFVLQWSPEPQDEYVASVFAEKIGKNQYMSLMLMPPQQGEVISIPREIVFVLDISGSMAGTSIQQAKAAVAHGLSRLQSFDRFNIIVFNTRASSLFSKSAAANSANIVKAQSFVSSIEAGGGTEIGEALLLALDGSHQHELLRQVVFLTDGAVSNEAELFALINSRLGDSRLFTVGIGSAPNSYFMRRSASMGKGAFTYIGKQLEVKEKMDELLTKIEHPAITDLKISIDTPGSDVEIYPSPLPDVYHGEPLVFAVRSGWENVQLQIVGTSAGKTWATTVDTSTFGRRTGVATFWARKKIANLMESLALGGRPSEIRKEVVHTALEHHLMSKYTSLVAVDENPSRPEGQPLGKGVVKNHLPQGWQSSPIFAGGLQTATPSFFLKVTGFLLLLISSLMYLRPWYLRAKNIS